MLSTAAKTLMRGSIFHPLGNRKGELSIRAKVIDMVKTSLRVSLQSPHPEAERLAEAGFEAWARSLPNEDSSELVDMKSGTALCWVPDKGWVITER